MECIRGHDLVTEALGRWPTFHDAKVLSASCAQGLCHASVHVFNMTDDVDAHGYYVLEDHHVVDFEFSGVSSCTLPDGYVDDILFELLVESDEHRVRVAFDSAVDPSFAWEVVCKTASVVKVTPLNPEPPVER